MWPQIFNLFSYFNKPSFCKVSILFALLIVLFFITLDVDIGWFVLFLDVVRFKICILYCNVVSWQVALSEHLFIEKLYIYETFNGGGVRRVQTLKPDHRWHTLFNRNSPQKVYKRSRILTISTEVKMNFNKTYINYPYVVTRFSFLHPNILNFSVKILNKTVLK